MGLVGLAACKNGLVAIADYKSDNTYEGKNNNINQDEDLYKATKKIFLMDQYLLVQYGSNIIKDKKWGKDIYLEDYFQKNEKKMKKAKKVEKFLKKTQKKFMYPEFYGFLFGYVDENGKYQVERFEFNLNTVPGHENDKKFIKTEYDENGVVYAGDMMMAKLMNIPFIYTKWVDVFQVEKDIKAKMTEIISGDKTESAALYGNKEPATEIFQAEKDRRYK